MTIVMATGDIPGTLHRLRSLPSGRYIYIMPAKTKQLQVKKSTLPGAGLGLFTKVNLPKGAQITEYKGTIRWWREVKKYDGHNAYLLRVSRTHAIDARSSKTFGRFANDALGLTRVPRLSNNAEYVVHGLRCFIEATRDIQKGEEILVSYGKEYWDLMRAIRKKGKGTRQTLSRMKITSKSSNPPKPGTRGSSPPLRSIHR